MPTRTKATLLTLLAALALATPARAAGAIALGPGRVPNVAVDAAGTAYVAWNGPEDSTSVSHPMFCRIPRGANACDVGPKQLAIGGTSLTTPHVFVAGSRVVVVSGRYGYPGSTFRATATTTSLDRGATFAAERKVWDRQVDDATAGPGDTISLVSGAELAFENIAGDGGPSSSGAAVIGGGGGGDAAVGLDGVTPVIIEYSDTGGHVDWRRHTGGSLNAKASWPAAGQSMGEFTYFSMGEGPLGLFAAGRIGSQMSVRKFTGAGWAAPAALSSSSGPVTAITQDAARRLHVLYTAGTELRYAASDDGATFRQGMLESAPSVDGLKAAAAADHIGVAVYRDAASVIQLVRFGPDVPAASAPAAPAPAPAAPAPAPPLTTPPLRRPAVLPKGSKPPATAVRLPGGRVLVAVKGAIRRPAGVSRTAGCRGKVAVRFKRGKRAIRAQTLALTRGCAFRRKITLAKLARAARALKMTVAFKGNAAVGPSRRTYTVPIKGRR